MWETVRPSETTCADLWHHSATRLPDLTGFNMHSAHNVTVNTHSLVWSEEQHIIISIVTEQLSLGTVGWPSMADTTASVSAPDWCTVTFENTSAQPPSVCSLTFTAALPQDEKRCVTHVCEIIFNFIYVTIHFKLFMLPFVQFKLFPNFSPKCLQ